MGTYPEPHQVDPDEAFEKLRQDELDVDIVRRDQVAQARPLLTEKGEAA